MFILKTFIVGFIPALVVSFSPRRLSYPFSKKISQSNSSATTTNVSPGRTSVFQLASSKPFAIVVDAEIVPDRRDEFLDLIEKDAVGSRGEPGCLRFDVHQSQDNPNRFFFYEVYKDADAVAFHKEQPHFALWTNFKESGGVVSSVSHKLDGIFMT